MAESVLVSAAEPSRASAALPGPFPVGRYAAALRGRLRGMARVRLVGEVTGARAGSGPNIYFELRDGDGALPCAMWRTDFERLPMRPDELRDGAEVVVAGGCDFYPGGATASPRFAFRVTDVRPAGEGDLLARLDRLRRRLAAEGLFERQKRLTRPALPRVLGVVTAEGSAARRDLLAALERRGWRGTIVWGYAAVQDRRAAPEVAAAIRDLAASAAVETIVVTRGGGSIADLWAFCDEMLCRTVALLPVPVISAVGHEVDRTLIDDVAAVSCSTPTHAAEAAVAVDCHRARAALWASAERMEASARGAVRGRARELAVASGAPRRALARHALALHQIGRELRASSRRRLTDRLAFQRRIGVTVIERKVAAGRATARAERAAALARALRLEAAGRSVLERRSETLAGRASALGAADPDRALERGFALALDWSGHPLESAAAARAAGAFRLRFSDASVPVRVADSAPVAPARSRGRR